MRKSLILLVIASGLVIGFTALLWPRSEQSLPIGQTPHDTEEETEEVSRRLEEDLPEQVVQQSDPEGAVIDAISTSPKPELLLATTAAKDFREADDAVEAAMIIERLYASGDNILASQLEWELTGACVSVSADEPESEATRWAWARLRKYCEEFDGIANSNAGSVKENDVSVFADEIEMAVGDIDRDAASEELTDILASVEYHHEIWALRTMLLDQATFDDSTYSIANLNEIPRSDYSSVIDAGLELYECRVFGGCGANGVRLLSRCVFDARCKEGWDYEALLYETLSPQQYRAVNDLVNGLLTRRKDLNAKG